MGSGSKELIALEFRLTEGGGVKIMGMGGGGDYSMIIQSNYLYILDHQQNNIESGGCLFNGF